METSDLVQEVEPKKIPNPTGKGGFQERPEQINRNGTWKPENSISFQFRRFINMTTEEFEDFRKIPKSKRTVAQHLAYQRIIAAEKSLPDMKEITDRVEGKAVQQIEMKAEIHSVDSILD